MSMYLNDFVLMIETENNQRLFDNYSQEDPERIYNTLYKMGEHGLIVPFYVRKDDAINILSKYAEIFIYDNIYNYMTKEHPELTKEEFTKFALNYLYMQVFEIRDGYYYKDIKEKILTLCYNQEQKKKRVLETINAYEQRLYFPASCALLSLIEGEMGEATSSSTTVWRDLLDTLLARSNDPNKMVYSENLKGFVSTLTQKAKFVGENEPKGLNRHWILHGRSHRDIWKNDCLSLLNAYELVLEFSVKGKKT